MILKSYNVEKNINVLDKKLSLFYGENLGLLDDLKNKIKENSEGEILNFTQEEILSNFDNFYSELKNISLFEKKKSFIIQNVNDKILNILQKNFEQLDENSIYLFAGILEKKSKIRNFFEKNRDINIIPCYKDNEASIKKIIIENLREYAGLTPQVINTISRTCSFDRIKLYNEIDKIKTTFIDKIIKFNELTKLLNLQEDEDFISIKDASLNGDVIKVNNFLNTTFLEDNKCITYLSILNFRLLKLKEILIKGEKNINQTIDEIKPPIFWKDKENFLFQAKLWSSEKLIRALSETYDIEIKMKSKQSISKNLLLKKLLVDICVLANAS